jgi:hypothetical protein
VKKATEREQWRFVSPMQTTGKVIAGQGEEHLERIEPFCIADDEDTTSQNDGHFDESRYHCDVCQLPMTISQSLCCDVDIWIGIVVQAYRLSTWQSFGKPNERLGNAEEKIYL